MRRFYERAESSATGEGRHRILLDGRPIRTPAAAELAVPYPALARLLAEEWGAQPAEFSPSELRLTRLASTVIDRMPALRADARRELLAFGETDLLFYHAAAPPELVARQAAAWQPWRDWGAKRLGTALPLGRTLAPVPASAALVEAMRRALDPLDDWRLVGLHAAATAAGSLLLGLALLDGGLGADRMFELAMLDELFEIERWGQEAEQQRRHRRMLADLAASEVFLRALDEA